jgi:hypothetical protein
MGIVAALQAWLAIADEVPRIIRKMDSRNLKTFGSREGGEFVGHAAACKWLRFGRLQWGGAMGILALAALTTAAQAQFTYVTNENSIAIASYDGTDAFVTIPSMVDGKPVTSIEHEAFRERTNLLGIAMPEGLLQIKGYVFTGCSGLREVVIPNSVTSIGAASFYQCSAVTNVVLGTGLTSIPHYAFVDCISLTNLTLGPNVREIGPYAFRRCLNLTTVHCPRSLRTIGPNAFLKCQELKTIRFDGNAPTLDTDVFEEADLVNSYYLPGTTGWGATLGGRPAWLWNPQMPTDDPSFGVQTDPDRFGFTITGSEDLEVVVEASTTIPGATWVPVGTNILFNGSSYFSDPDWAEHPGRFYRLRSP